MSHHWQDDGGEEPEVTDEFGDLDDDMVDLTLSFSTKSTRGFVEELVRQTDANYQQISNLLNSVLDQLGEYPDESMSWLFGGSQ